MGWFTKRGQRVHGVGGYAVALRLNGWTPEDDTDDAPEVELTVEHRTHADLTDDEFDDVERAVRDETPPGSF